MTGWLRFARRLTLTSLRVMLNYSSERRARQVLLSLLHNTPYVQAWDNSYRNRDLNSMLVYHPGARARQGPDGLANLTA